MFKIKYEPLLIIAFLIAMSILIADYESQYNGTKLFIHIVGFVAIFYFSNWNIKMSKFTLSALGWTIGITVVIGITACCAIAGRHLEDGTYDALSHISRLAYIAGALLAVYLPHIIKEYEEIAKQSN